MFYIKVKTEKDTYEFDDIRVNWDSVKGKVKSIEIFTSKGNDTEVTKKVHLAGLNKKFLFNQGFARFGRNDKDVTLVVGCFSDDEFYAYQFFQSGSHVERPDLERFIRSLSNQTHQRIVK